MAKQEPYDVGDTVNIDSAFTDAAEVPADPTSAILEILTPSKAKTTIAFGALTHVGTGHYRYPVTLTEGGTWTFRYKGSGTIPLVRILHVRVREDPFA